MAYNKALFADRLDYFIEATVGQPLAMVPVGTVSQGVSAVNPRGAQHEREEREDREDRDRFHFFP